MGDPIQRALVDRGHRVRVYTPYGAMLPGMAYLVRRLLENTSNESFLKASLAEQAPVDDLLRDPEEIGAMLTRTRRPKADAARLSHGRACRRSGTSRRPTSPGPRTARRCARRSSRCARSSAGRIRSSIGGQEIRHRGRAARFASTPATARGSSARSSLAGVEHAEAAVAAARSGLPGLVGDAGPRSAPAVLIEAAAIMRNRRFELAAWEVYECGKPWPEADADVAEAIDFCEFYAREMIRLAEPRHRDVPGETNFTEHHPARRRRRHPPLELPAGDPHRHDRRRAGHRQHRRS